jgi:hypothetical protein
LKKGEEGAGIAKADLGVLWCSVFFGDFVVILLLNAG